MKISRKSVLAILAPYLLRVVDLPDEGFPTRPMRGSRGISKPPMRVGRQNRKTLQAFGKRSEISLDYSPRIEKRFIRKKIGRVFFRQWASPGRLQYFSSCEHLILSLYVVDHTTLSIMTAKVHRFHMVTAICSRYEHFNCFLCSSNDDVICTIDLILQ